MKRTNHQMMDLILMVAQENEMVRVATLEGSRTNINATSDEYQDYDVSFVVSDLQHFKENENWIDVFGKRIILQKPEAMTLFAPELGNWYSYLMLFEDGNRIDLTLIPIEELEMYLDSDSLIQILIDKDGRVKNHPGPSDRQYHIKKPNELEFDDCCNEFWWVSTYVVKGILRDEFLYVVDHINLIFRKELLRMIEWMVGFETDFSLSVGKNLKHLEKYVSKECFQKIVSTFQMSSIDCCLSSFYTICDLFRETSKEVARRLKVNYPDYDEKISQFNNNLLLSYEKSCLM